MNYKYPVIARTQFTSFILYDRRYISWSYILSDTSPIIGPNTKKTSANIFKYTFRTVSNFWIKFGNSDQSFSRNILTSLHLNFKTFVYVQIAITRYYILFKNTLTWYKVRLNTGAILSSIKLVCVFNNLVTQLFLKMYTNQNSDQIHDFI